MTFFDTLHFKKKFPECRIPVKLISIVKLISYVQSWCKELRHLGYVFKMLLLVPNVEKVWPLGKYSKLS